MKTTGTGNLIIKGKKAILEYIDQYCDMYLLETTEELPNFPMCGTHFNNWLTGEELRYLLETTDLVDDRVKVNAYGMMIPRQSNNKGQ